MNWTQERAAEQQLSRLKQFGYEPDHPLSKGEAAHLIRDFEACRQRETVLAESATRELAEHEAYHLRSAVDRTRRVIAQAGKDEIENLRHDLALAIAKRQELWMDTCGDAERMHPVSTQAHELSKKYGSRFAVPTAQQVQDIFDALDSALPFWDRDDPGLFYQTLELNFPELVRHPAGRGG